MPAPEKMTFHLYGRTAYPEPLTFIETVRVTDVREVSLSTAEKWVELVAIPETAVIQVIPRPQEDTT